jgi:hypothetical protein
MEKTFSNSKLYLNYVCNSNMMAQTHFSMLFSIKYNYKLEKPCRRQPLEKFKE